MASRCGSHRTGQVRSTGDLIILMAHSHTPDHSNTDVQAAVGAGRGGPRAGRGLRFGGGAYPFGEPIAAPAWAALLPCRVPSVSGPIGGPILVLDPALAPCPLPSLISLPRPLPHTSVPRPSVSRCVCRHLSATFCLSPPVCQHLRLLPTLHFLLLSLHYLPVDFCLSFHAPAVFYLSVPVYRFLSVASCLPPVEQHLIAVCLSPEPLFDFAICKYSPVYCLLPVSGCYPGIKLCYLPVALFITICNLRFLPNYEHSALLRLCRLQTSTTGCKVGHNHWSNHLSITTCQTFSIFYHQYNVTTFHYGQSFKFIMHFVSVLSTESVQHTQASLFLSMNSSTLTTIQSPWHASL